jgi:LysM repeat protein
VAGSPAPALAEPPGPALAGPPSPAALPSPGAAVGASPSPVGAGEAASEPPESEPPTPEPRPTRAPLAGRNPDGLALHVLRYVPLIVEIGAEVGADPAVLAALMEVELSGEDAVSRAGALGLMQIMPDKLEPGDDPFHPPTNIRRAAQHLRWLSARWKGDLAAVAGSYFGAVDAEGYLTEASDGIATGTEYVDRFAAAYRRWAPFLGQPVRPVVMQIRPPDGPVVLHTVRPGDSARGLAARYGISLATLVAANELTDSGRLAVGQELRIPTVDGVLHSFEPGESLDQLAEGYGVPVDSLLKANRLDGEPAAGTLLVVPGVDPTQPIGPTAVVSARPTRFAAIPVVSSPHRLAIRPGRSHYLMYILAPV